ncbi:MAG: hypothetical protein KDB53_06585, partial [Planctomycetes bacterium]|nr:hypothetical protein [Planctomycetota bacterium]
FPDADIVLDLDIGRLRDHRKVDLDRQISLIRPRSSAWALPFLDDFHRMERVVYAVSFLSQGLRLQVVIEASPGSGGLPALQDHDPLRASALTERLGATSKIASSIDRWELTVELPVDGLVKLMNWLQEAPAPPAIRTQLRLVAFAKRLREVGEAALTIPSLDGWGRPIQHLPTPRGMKLFSLGADGRPGGDDDDRDFELIVDH